jgi:hypothetical protein
MMYEEEDTCHMRRRIQTSLEGFTALHDVFDVEEAREIVGEQREKVAFLFRQFAVRENLKKKYYKNNIIFLFRQFAVRENLYMYMYMCMCMCMYMYTHTHTHITHTHTHTHTLLCVCVCVCVYCCW